MSQQEHSAANRTAWSHKAYEAPHQGRGTPAEAAAGLKENPTYPLRDYIQHLGDLQGQRVANLLGSYGRRAVAMALLGAEVTVVDIAEGNRRYALEQAEAAGVSIEFILADLMEWPYDGYRDCFDLVFMEQGILHYFVDLDPLAALIHAILKPGGRLVLHEFHPFNKKMAPERDGERVVLTDDYFFSEIREAPVPYHGNFTPEEAADFPKCLVRRWTLGEIITAVAASGLRINILEEMPHSELKIVPNLFTLVAGKDAR